MIPRSQSSLLNKTLLWVWVSVFFFALNGCDRPPPAPSETTPIKVASVQGPLSYNIIPEQAEGERQAGIDGLEHDLLIEFAASQKWPYELEPIAQDKVGQALEHASKHLVMGWLGPFVQSSAVPSVPFSTTWDVLVSHSDLGLGKTPIDALAGKRIHVVAGSHAAGMLTEAKQQNPSIQLIQLRGVDSLALLERVANHEIDYAAVDHDAYSIALNYFPVLSDPLNISDGYPISWFFPKGTDPQLIERVNQFLLLSQKNGLVQKLRDKYLGHLDRISAQDITTYLESIQSTLPRYRALFQEAQDNTGFDWRLLAAIAYQESRWNPEATSRTNVRGMMMLTEDTAERLGIRDRLNARDSILGGARYLKLLRSKIPSSVPEPDRTWIALAGYNLGPGNLLLSRQFAQRNHFNANQWFDMKKALPRFARVSRARGGEAVIMVETVRLLYDTLQRYEAPHRTRITRRGHPLGSGAHLLLPRREDRSQPPQTGSKKRRSSH